MSKVGYSQPPCYITIGKVGRPYSYQGWFHITQQHNLSIDLITCLPWHIKQPHQTKMLKISQAKRMNHKKIIAVCDSVADASSLLHHEIVVKNTQLPPLPNNRYYDFQLIGLTVFQGNHCFGHVQSIAHHPANDNLVIEKDGKINRLIPLIYDEIIQSVDLEKKTIEVNWYIESS